MISWRQADRGPGLHIGPSVGPAGIGAPGMTERTQQHRCDTHTYMQRSIVWAESSAVTVVRGGVDDSGRDG